MRYRFAIILITFFEERKNESEMCISVGDSFVGWVS